MLKNKSFFIFIFSAILLLAPVFFVQAAVNYYIDPINGNNDASGLATSTAWKDFRNIYSYRGDKVGALSYKSHLVNLAAGNVVYVMDGTISTLYRAGDDSGAAGKFGDPGVSGMPAILYFRSVNGTALAPIKIMAYPGAHPVLDSQYQGGDLPFINAIILNFPGLPFEML